MSGIGRGTTPINTFKTSIDLTNANVIYITYSQLEQTVIEKTIEDIVSINATSLSVKLTQKETLRLKSEYPVKIQIRAGFGGDGGDRVRSNIMVTTVEPILKGGVI